MLRAAARADPNRTEFVGGAEQRGENGTASGSQRSLRASDQRPAPAIREELILKNEPREVSAQEVQAALDALLQGEDVRMFPHGKRPSVEPLASIKGSRALENLYEHFGLPYHKEKSGVLIAKYISANNQPALLEITALIRPLFARR